MSSFLNGVKIMNKVIRDAYFHICNGGARILIEEEVNKDNTKTPVFVIEWDTFGNLKTTFEMRTRKEYIHALGEMLIEAANMLEDNNTTFYGTPAKMYWVKDETGKEIRNPHKEYGFLND